MRYAVSIYLGGEVVSASELTADKDPYSYTRRFGLVCPNCKEAVFWRRDWMRGNTFVPSSFCHYHNDDPVFQECDLRSRRIDNSEYKLQLDMEAKKQRLELFNKYFWDIFQENSFYSSLLRQAIKLRSIKGLGLQALPKVRRELRVNSDFWQSELESLLSSAQGGLILGNGFSPLYKVFGKEPTLEAIHYISKLDKRVQSLISQEAMLFLSTRTGGFALEKIVRFSLVKLADAFILANSEGSDRSHSQQIEISGSLDSVTTCLPALTRIVDSKTDFLVRSVITSIIAINWVKVFKEKSSETIEIN